MRIPFINSDDALHKKVEAACGEPKRKLSGRRKAGEAPAYSVVPLPDPASAIEHINYQTPSLIIINFSDPGFDGFGIMDQIIADPWLNNGSIIAVHEQAETLEKINDLEETNIIISLSHGEVDSLLPKVLKVIRKNEQILFQRAIQSDLAADISGRFSLGSDVFIIPCYANLIANYLFNMGFVDARKKNRLSLSLAELLINGIEHGNCGITSEEKTRYLEAHGTIHGLIEKKNKDPRITRRRVTFQYDIRRDASAYQISDEGEGFDWKGYTDPGREVDLLSNHGRGILLTLGSVDRLTYNEKGNQVEVVVEHQQNTTNTVPLVFRDHETLEVRPGDVVFRQGEESNFLYYVAEGEYGVEVNGKRLATINPADILMGEMSFLLQESRSATVVATTHGRLIKISTVAFVNSIKNQPYYGLFLAKLLAKRLYNLGRTIVK